MAHDLPAPPEGVPATREAIAEYHARHIAPCSARTVEGWPITYRRLNGRAVAEWPNVLDYLRERYDRAHVHRGGKRHAA